MKLVENWQQIACRAKSMWANYLGIFCLVVPDIVYLVTLVDMSPRWLYFLALALLIYGSVFRLEDQGIQRNKTQSPWLVGAVGLALVAAVYFGHGPAPSTPAQTVELAAEVEAEEASPDPFLEIAVPFIGRWEGLRLAAYQDIVGVWTVCYGETKGVKPGDQYTKAECDAMLAREIQAYRVGWHAYVGADVLAELPVKRDVAFTSLAYNVGVSGAGKSTATRRLNAGNIAGACEALGWWNKAGGRVVRGLVNRRAEETTLCLDGVA